MKNQTPAAPGRLKTLYPDLPFSAEADTFLEINGKCVWDQLKERRITEIRIQPLLMSAGGLKTTVSVGNFCIVLGEDTPIEERPTVLGHELAHTFFYDDDSAWPPELRVPPPEEISDKLYKRLEEFCRSFAELWLAKNSRDEVSRFVSRDVVLV